MSDGMSIDGMLDMYLFENGQLLEQLEQTTLDKKDNECFDEADINDFFRIMHTIKGSSGVMMYDDIMKLSHKLEDVFYFIRESHPEHVPHLELVDCILMVSDFISNEFEKIKSGKEPNGDATELIDKIEQFLVKIKGNNTGKSNVKLLDKREEQPKQFYIGPASAKKGNCFSVVIYYRNDTLMCNIRAYTAVHTLKEKAKEIFYEPEDILTNEETADYILEHGFTIFLRTELEAEEVKKLLDSSGVEAIDISECEQSIFSGNADTDSKDEMPSEINLEVLPKVDKDRAPKPGDYVIESKQSGKQKKFVNQGKEKAQIQSFISVNVEKIDALMDLIGEIVIAQSVVLQNNDLKVPGLSLNNFKKAAAQLTKFTSELQDVIMSMRMMPLTNVFQKMKRIVFDTSRKLQKEVDLEVIGENTEVDKSIIEHISDPLMHMIRNSVDHGIEEKEERQAAGKPEKGMITLEARNEGGKVLIIVKDDGKGMSTTKLFEKAKKNGLVPREKVESDYSKKDILQFITYPGFSTNEQVTELSGRGVGMDVVVKNIQSIGGTLEIESEEGKGSVMTMKIPLTLAIIDGIVMKVGNMTFALETGVIKEFINVKEMDMVVEPDGEEYASIRGDFFPVIRLSERYHIDHAATNVEEGIMILAEHDKKQVCLFVDQLIGGQEIVVKPIPSYVKKVDGLSGCTQLGDGSIALILDVAGLF